MFVDFASSCERLHSLPNEFVKVLKPEIFHEVQRASL
jgi:hypothetical protein